MKLSIIIPYYNVKEYTDELLDCLNKQINEDVEVILVDDASPEPYKTKYKWCKVRRHRNNKNSSGARNTGLEMATGDYIQFIDADDMVPDYFIERLFMEIDENPFDVCDYSWRSLGTEGMQHNHLIPDRTGRLPNPSACTRCFSREFIGNVRFNTKKDSTEDEEFSRKLGYLGNWRPRKHTAIGDYMYFYRTYVSNSKVKLYKRGLLKTKRIAYYYNHVTEDMQDLFEEIKKEDELNEVFLLTNKNDIPELEKYCQVWHPIHIWTHELRGEPYSKCEIIEPPINSQVIIYCEHIETVGGISSVIYNFCLYMHKHYDILVLYQAMEPVQIQKISQIVQVMQYDPDKTYVCDSLILNRLTDKIHDNISFRQSIQICHACKQPNYHIPQDRDILVNVSQAAKESWEEEAKNGIVIHNMSHVSSERCLLLVSATRVHTDDKGKNDERMRKLAQMLCNKGIKFIWLNFSNGGLRDMPDTFINMPAKVNIHPYIARADYLVQLSDAEAYSMSILEALELGTAVLATPFPSLFEQGFEDEVNGHLIPFDMDFNPEILLKVPKFKFKSDNAEIINQWKEILGESNPKGLYRPEKLVVIECINNYRDTELGRHINAGEQIRVPEHRAALICNAGFGRRINGEI